MPPRSSSRISSKPPSAAASKPASKAKPASKPASKAKASPKAPVSSSKAAPAAAPASRKRGATAELANGGDAPKKQPSKRRRIAEVNAVPQPPAPESLDVFVWGTGDNGQFGMGPDDMDEKNRPRHNEWFDEQREKGNIGAGPGKGGVECIAAGGMHNLAVDEKGQVYSWGQNDESELGRKTKDVPDPEKKGAFLLPEDLETWPFVVDALNKEGFRAVKVSAGDTLSVALSDKGELRAWGTFRGPNGVLGFDATSGFGSIQAEPTALPKLRGVEVVDVACGNNHALALTTEGHVYTWGDNESSQLGRRVMARRPLNCLEPERLRLRNIVHIAAGKYHSFAVDKDGKVYMWGLNGDHQGGLSGRDADEAVIESPVEVTSLSPDEHGGARVVQIAGGDKHSLFLFDNGEVWGCGLCDGGELGLGPDHPAQAGLSERREHIKAEREQDIVEAKAKLAAVEADPKADDEDKEKAKQALDTAEGTLHIRIVGDYVPEPVRIAFPPVPEQYEVVPELPAWSEPATNPIACISAGLHSSFAVSRSGHLYAWGSGPCAELGLGNVEEQKTPGLVRSKWLRPFNSVVVRGGGQHTVVLAKRRDE